MTSRPIFLTIFQRSIAIGLVIFATLTFTIAQSGESGSNNGKNSAEQLTNEKIKDKARETIEGPGKDVGVNPELAISDSEMLKNPRYSKLDFNLEKTRAPRKQQSNSEWEFAFAPYLYATG